MSTTITTENLMYHASPLNGMGASEWTRGGARKGVNGIRREIGLIMFDATQIAAALTGQHTLPAAQLQLTRDASYGTQNVDISIAPAYVEVVGGAMTYADCLDLAMRRYHHLAVVGAEPQIPLPGAWLRLLKEGLINAVFLYQEDGEGTNGYVRFTGDAKLVLDVDAAYQTPVWTRSIGTGDEISGLICSHVADLKELEYYADLRNGTATGLNLGDTCDYADWYEIIMALRTAIDPERAWCTVTDDDLPKAEVINELRNALEEAPGGQTKQMVVTEYGRALVSFSVTDREVNYNETLSWQGALPPSSGRRWIYEYGQGVKTKVWYHRFGYWELLGLLEGQNVSSAKLRLKRTEGSEGPVYLHPLISDDLAGKRRTLNDTMNRTINCGQVTAVAGETVEVELSSELIEHMTSADPNVQTWYGVGIYDKDVNAMFDASATLIINDT